MSEQLPDGGIELSPADIEALDARWSSCWTPNDVARRLSGTATPWYVAAGWAIDLFRGAQTRTHGDIEIAIPAASFPRCAAASPGTSSTRSAAAGSGRTPRRTCWPPPTRHGCATRPPATTCSTYSANRTTATPGSAGGTRRSGFPIATSSVTPGTASRTWPPSWSCCSRPSTPAARISRLRRDPPAPTPPQRQTLAALLTRTHPGHPWLAPVTLPAVFCVFILATSRCRPLRAAPAPVGGPVLDHRPRATTQEPFHSQQRRRLQHASTPARGDRDRDVMRAAALQRSRVAGEAHHDGQADRGQHDPPDRMSAPGCGLRMRACSGSGSAGTLLAATPLVLPHRSPPSPYQR